jgi:hypothetical protein
MARISRTRSKKPGGAKPSRTPPRKSRGAKPGASAKPRKAVQSRTTTGVPHYPL